MIILQGEIGDEITLKDFTDKQSIMINSPGGSLYEGLAMYDYVKSKDIEVGVIGLCASAATLPLIASSKRWGTPNSNYLIHNPSQSIFWANLTAEDMNHSAIELQKEQDRALNLYLSVLTGTKEEIQAIMNEERMLSAEEALLLGLITEIKDIPSDVTPEQKQEITSLYHKYSMKLTKMENNSEIKKEFSGLRLLLEDIKLLFKANSSVKMLVLQDVNGAELDFGTYLQSKEEVIVGVKATVAGAPANGEYTMPGGEVYEFEAGVLSSINQPMDSGNEALKAENEALKVKLADLETETTLLREDNEVKSKMVKDIDLKLKEFSMKFEEIQKNIPEPKQNITIPPIVQNKKEHGFSWNFKN